MEEKEIKEVLLDNALEYKRNAVASKERGDYNTSVTLFFKALVALSDLYIFVEEGRVPSNQRGL